jgi:hypothetical protein
MRRFAQETAAQGLRLDDPSLGEEIGDRQQCRRQAAASRSCAAVASASAHCGPGLAQQRHTSMLVARE